MGRYFHTKPKFSIMQRSVAHPFGGWCTRQIAVFAVNAFGRGSMNHSLLYVWDGKINRCSHAIWWNLGVNQAWPLMLNAQQWWRHWGKDVSHAASIQSFASCPLVESSVALTSLYVPSAPLPNHKPFSGSSVRESGSLVVSPGLC